LVAAVCCTAVAAYGFGAGAGFRYWISCLTAAAAILAIEAKRLMRSPAAPWWITQSLALPWVAVVILPWTWRIVTGRSYVGSRFPPLDLDLPLTWSVNLLALLGFTAGTLMAIRKATIRKVDLGRVRTEPAALTLMLIFFAFLASYVVAGRPLGSFWRLSGEYSYYSRPETRTSFGPLDLTPVIAIMFVLTLAALRRGYRRRPTVVELVALLLTGIMTLGSGSRTTFLLLTLGWLSIQWLPADTHDRVDRRATRRNVSLLLCGLVLAGSFVGLGLIAQARTPNRGGSETGGALTVSIESLDVIWSSEMLVARGAQLGGLRGRTYTDLPQQLVPRMAAGGQKQEPLTIQTTEEYLDPHAGFSAPYWMESALNFGRGGTLIYSFLLALLMVRVQLRALSSSRPMAQVFRRVGPVVLLVLYLLLGRISSEQLLHGIGGLVSGAWLAVRTLPRRGDRAKGYDHGYRALSGSGRPGRVPERMRVAASGTSRPVQPAFPSPRDRPTSLGVLGVWRS